MHSVIRSFAFLVALAVFAWGAPAANAQGIDFNRDIRPILSDHCFACHGPDEEKLEADLRLDSRDGLFRESDDIHVVVPGELQRSELFRRISSTDPDEQMPPKDFGRPLKPAQIELIRRWIESGAEWKQHWSFIAPKRPAAPEVSQPDWIANAIDNFVLARLDREQLKPSAPADRQTLIRRVTFDLTGLPPTPAEVKAFVNDKSDNAYEKVVDRLLKSSRYAERMAIRWLDYARYADTSGYQSDGPREMWRWRDWVIEAFHKNKPFDQFTVEQLAGDLLARRVVVWELSDLEVDHDTAFADFRRQRDLRMASAFNRNHRGNAEGGIVPEEFQVEYVVDRVDTTFAIWQGLTIGCARCHSHKYDPISQNEYYQAFAYFNNIPEYGRALKEGNSPPWMLAPTDDQLHQLMRLQGDQVRMVDELFPLEEELFETKKGFRRWRKAVGSYIRQNDVTDWTVTDGLVVDLRLDDSAENTASSEEGDTAAARLVGSDTPVFVDGVRGQAMKFDGKSHLEIEGVADFGYMDPFTLGARVYLEEGQGGTIISRMEPGERGAGFSLHVTESGTVQVNFVKRWLDDSLRVETKDPLPTGRWVHVLATYDGSRVSGEWTVEPGGFGKDWQLAAGISIFIDGTLADKHANLDGINQTFAVEQPLRIGQGNAPFTGLIDDVRVYNRWLHPDEVCVVASDKSITELHAKFDTAEKVNSSDDTADRVKYRFFTDQIAGPPEALAVFRKAWQLELQVSELVESLPKLMIMEESKQPRDTHLLKRGQYDNPGERVSTGVPSALPPLPANSPTNRLGLASWLVQPDNPLTARVTVNRFWRDVFGTGLVKTAEDFGVQGERPSHPQLLDWLAVEFVESGWDMKHIIKTMVMSNTYRQSSRLTRELYDRDPDNRLLARGARFRLPAEMIRDQALFISGLLTERLGGPSVKPYQPEGLWEEIATDKVYEQSKGADLYRRSLYTYWKRTVAPPMMAIFDASGREACQVNMTRTNTPLAALNLLNDVTFVEAARVLAADLLAQPHTSHQIRLNAAYERILARRPTTAESAILLASHKAYREHFRNDVEAVIELVNAGDAPGYIDGNLVELAAWTTICSTLLNLDETVTRD